MEQVERQEHAAVAVAATPAAAEVVATMLQVHGLQAWTEAYAAVYPSVAWVEGYRVQVAAGDLDEALRVLHALDRTDTAVLDDSSGA
ncbi:MAG: D-aminopeptidase [Myxococcota bacterium]|jgi:D-aminopeptidase